MHKLRLLTLVALAGLVVVSVAAARPVIIRGTNHDDVLTGTPGNDIIFAKAGNDAVSALAGDHQVDTLDCGSGYDAVWLNASEQDTQVNCEVVHVVSTLTPGG